MKLGYQYDSMVYQCYGSNKNIVFLERKIIHPFCRKEQQPSEFPKLWFLISENKTTQIAMAPKGSLYHLRCNGSSFTVIKN